MEVSGPEPPKNAQLLRARGHLKWFHRKLFRFGIFGRFLKTGVLQEDVFSTNSVLEFLRCYMQMTDLTNLSTGIVLVSDPEELLRLNGLEEFLLLGEPGRPSLP